MLPINSVTKILEGACSRKTKQHIPQNAFWLNRLFFDLANTNDKICLTIDSSGVNKAGLVDLEQRLRILNFKFAILIQNTTSKFITSLSVKE